MIRDHAEGFDPVFDENSRVLILGSFPSVRSREVAFYYGNPQNRFWRTIGRILGEEIPDDIGGKKRFLLRHGIALWDIVASCDIVGSSDASIEHAVPADIPHIFAAAPVGKILCNGSKAFELLTKYFPQYASMAEKLPSTSPANPRFSYAAWERALALPTKIHSDY